MAEKNKTRSDRGFTLLELILVLLIISAMMTVVVPYATRSNNSRKSREEILNVMEIIRYAIKIADDEHLATRFVLNPRENSYSIEIAEEFGENNFQMLERSPGGIRYLDKTAKIIDIDGFESGSSEHYLVFDPAKAWPNGSFKICTVDETVRVGIKGRRVEIK